MNWNIGVSTTPTSPGARVRTYTPKATSPAPAAQAMSRQSVSGAGRPSWRVGV